MTLGDAVVRLGLSFLLALPLGWERDQRSRWGGQRSYLMLSACVCAFVLIAQSAGWGPSEQANAFYGALGGIGFVCAGAILKSAEGARGRSTAARLWVTGAIGAGVAYGIPLVSVALSLMSVAVLAGASLLTGHGRS